MSRQVTFYSFCSIKGGVGKSALAVACAKLLAAGGRIPVLVDAALTGTSLSDGLLLRAPKVPLRDDGALDLDAPPTGEFYEVSETRQLRNARKNALDEDATPPPVYLNDALNYQSKTNGQECRVDALLWKHDRDDGVLYLPSSPLPRDVKTNLGWIYDEQPFAWVCRFAWVLDALLEQLPQLTDVIVDLPPGVVGLPHETLVLASALARRDRLPEGYPAWSTSGIDWQVLPILVTTLDWNDLLPALEYVAATSVHLPALRPLINRAGATGLVDLRVELAKRLDPTLGDIGVHEPLDHVPELNRSLGQLFRAGDLVLDDIYLQNVSTALRLGGVR